MSSLLTPTTLKDLLYSMSLKAIVQNNRKYLDEFTEALNASSYMGGNFLKMQALTNEAIEDALKSILIYCMRIKDSRLSLLF